MLILICINYMFRPTMAIIRFITYLRGCGGIDKEISVSIFVALLSGVVWTIQGVPGGTCKTYVKVFVRGSGRKSSFTTCWTWPLSTVTSFYLHAVGRKFHTEIFDSPLSERSWHDLGMSHNHPSLLEDQPKLPLTSKDWTHDTINFGLPAVIHSVVVACVRRGVWRVPTS
jgi:hypothetical protein